MAEPMNPFLNRRMVLSLVTLAVAGGLLMAWHLGRVALRPVAWYSGWLLLVMLLGLAFFNVRKKLPFFPLITASHWLQLHIYAGWLAVAVFLLHTGARLPDGLIESVLALCFWAVAVSGVFGLWLSRWLPPRLTRSGESLIYERIPMLRHRLVAEIRDLVRTAEAETQSTTLGDFYVRVLAGYFALRPTWYAPLAGSDADNHLVRQELQGLRRFLNPRELTFADQVAELIEAKRNLDHQFAGQRLLKLWLFAHIPLTFVLLVFVGAHVWLVVQYSHR
jgi:hypothetical protein